MNQTYELEVIRTSRTKYDESGIPISKMEDYQTSMSSFSTKNVSNNANLSDFKDKLNKNKSKKKVEFNPLITVINIESYKKENYYGVHVNEANDDANKKCILCSIF